MCSPLLIYDLALLFKKYNILSSSIQISFISSTQKFNFTDMQKSIVFLQKQGIKVGLKHLNINASTLALLNEINFNAVNPISTSLVNEISEKTQEINLIHPFNFCENLRIDVIHDELYSIIESQYIKKISNQNSKIKEYLSFKELSKLLNYYKKHNINQYIVN